MVLARQSCVLEFGPAFIGEMKLAASLEQGSAFQSQVIDRQDWVAALQKFFQEPEVYADWKLQTLYHTYQSYIKTFVRRAS